MIELRVRCATCNSILAAEVTLPSIGSQPSLIVEPCPKCIVDTTTLKTEIAKLFKTDGSVKVAGK